MSEAMDTVIPVLPLKNSVLFPHPVTPLAIGRPASVAAVDAALGREDKRLGVFAQKDASIEEPKPSDLYAIGTVGVIKKAGRNEDTMQIVVQGSERVQVVGVGLEQPFLSLVVRPLPVPDDSGPEVEALQRAVLELAGKMLQLLQPQIQTNLSHILAEVDDPLHQVYLIASLLSLEVEKEHALLAAPTRREALRLVHELLNHEVQVLELRNKITSEAQSEMSRQQREYLLRQQLRAIQGELGEQSPEQAEAELRGHRRTYIGAMPGRIIRAIRRAGVKNPLLMLDEVDKLGRDFRGDPSAALMEILDPAQNNAFHDNYLDLPFDLSQVFFITTANTLDTIPRPLLDPMETLRLSGYSDEEKREIARRYLVGRQLREAGLTAEQLSIPDETLDWLIRRCRVQAEAAARVVGAAGSLRVPLPARAGPHPQALRLLGDVLRVRAARHAGAGGGRESLPAGVHRLRRAGGLRPRGRERPPGPGGRRGGPGRPGRADPGAARRRLAPRERGQLPDRARVRLGPIRGEARGISGSVAGSGERSGRVNGTRLGGLLAALGYEPSGAARRARGRWGVCCSACKTGSHASVGGSDATGSGCI